MFRSALLILLALMGMYHPNPPVVDRPVVHEVSRSRPLITTPTIVKQKISTTSGQELKAPSSKQMFTATCYTLQGTTASGRRTGPGVIAVDPRIIPIGTRMIIEGYGEGIAADTGSAIKGHIIDVWMDSLADCRQWGRRTVNVNF